MTAASTSFVIPAAELPAPPKLPWRDRFPRRRRFRAALIASDPLTVMLRPRIDAAIADLGRAPGYHVMWSRDPDGSLRITVTAKPEPGNVLEHVS